MAVNWRLTEVNEPEADGCTRGYAQVKGRPRLVQCICCVRRSSLVALVWLSKKFFSLTLHPLGGVIRTGVEPQLKGCVSTSRGEIPLPRPCQKGVGSGPCANVPNESMWPMLRLPQWVTVAYTNGWRTGLLVIR